MKKTEPYFGGIPTEPDVKKLERHFGVPQAGLIAHEDVEAIIGAARDSTRYRTIVGAWRRRLLREENIATAADPGKGIRVLTEPERVDHAQRHLGLSARKVLREHRWALMIDASKLDEVAMRKRDHVVRASAAMAVAATTSVKELTSALRAPAQLPRKAS